MATTLIGVLNTDYTHSVKAEQSGINVESITYRTEPEFRESLPNISGHQKGEAVGDPMTTLTITGETIRNGSSALQGLLAGNFTTDQTGTLVLTSSGPAMSGPVTEFVAQNAEVIQSRGTWEKGTVSYIARSQMTVT